MAKYLELKHINQSINQSSLTCEKLLDCYIVIQFYACDIGAKFYQEQAQCDHCDGSLNWLSQWRVHAYMHACIFFRKATCLHSFVLLHTLFSVNTAHAWFYYFVPCINDKPEPPRLHSQLTSQFSTSVPQRERNHHK